MNRTSLAHLAALAVATTLACGSDRVIAPATPGSGARPDGGSGSRSDAGARADAGFRAGTHTARCIDGCALPADGPCASGGDLVRCADTCTVLAEGLSAACASCVLERSGWAGTRCTCVGAGCNACGFGPGGVACESPAPTDTCAPSDESCSGFEAASVTRGACADVCVGEGTTPTIGSLDDRCAIACQKPRSGPCSDADEAGCVASCKIRLAGLPAACAMCVIEDSGWAGERCSCVGDGCTACPFGPGGRPCQSPLPQDTCGPSDESCTGFEVGAIGSGRCAAFCD